MSANRPTGERGQRLTYLVKRLEMAERARMEEVLRPLGVTLHQYTAMSILERREGPDRRKGRQSGGKRETRDRRRPRIPGTFLETEGEAGSAD